MDWGLLFFYLFGTLAVIAALMVVVSSSPVHSVFFLILSFVTGSGLMILLGAEFLAMILTVVYVGAVAVLFLFVVMMLDVSATRLRRGIATNLPLGLVLVGALAATIIVALSDIRGLTRPLGVAAQTAGGNPETVENTRQIGSVLYTEYFLEFQIAAAILLVAMIGAIVLTLRHRKQVKRQDPGRQARRRVEDAIELHAVKPGQGV